jgi:hypothetical protein
MGIRTDFIDKIIDGQQRRAQFYANEALNRMDDRTLTGLGYDPAELRSRPRRPIPLC